MGNETNPGAGDGSVERLPAVELVAVVEALSPAQEALLHENEALDANLREAVSLLRQAAHLARYQQPSLERQIQAFLSTLKLEPAPDGNGRPVR